MCDTAKGFCVRVFGIAGVQMDDTESTFAELSQRVARTIEILQSVDEEKLDAKKATEEPVLAGIYRFESGQIFLSEYTIPNFHFHMTAAYCILRHQGVPIGFFDYLGDVFHKAP